MKQVDHDNNPNSAPQIVVTPTEARGGIIGHRVIWILVVGVSLAVIAMVLFGAK